MTTINRELLAGSWRSWLDKGPKRVGPYWMQLVWTLLLCLLIAAGFTIFGFAAHASGDGAWRNLPAWGHYYLLNLRIALLIGAVCHGLFELGPRLFGYRRLMAFKPWQRALYYNGIALLGLAISWPFAVAVSDQDGSIAQALSDPNAIASSVLLSLLLSSVLYVFFHTKNRQIQAERRATEAQLRLLQGQIEPHFLFNTLANVQALIDVDAPKAKAMLESFTDYLRGSLGGLRGERRTLGDEIEMTRSYLSLLKTRMDERLAFSIDDEPALRHASLPPLLLQPLVENAIHHGLEPKLEGGRVRVTARREGDELLLTVTDDGLGLASPKARRGAGMALANLRERLAARYGRQASLTLTDNHPGTTAAIRLPFETFTP